MTTASSSNQSYIDFTWIGQDFKGRIIYNNTNSNFKFYTGATLTGQLDSAGIYANGHLSLSDISLKRNIENVNLSECYQL
jgi:hypothetical protein